MEPTAMSAEPIPIRSEPAHPPMFSVEAEKSVLGGLMARPELSDVAAPALEEWMFYREAHRRMWRAMRTLSDRGASFDALSLQERLVVAGDLDAAGGTAYLAELSDWVPTTSEAHLRHHVQIVRRHAARRRLHERAAQVQEFVRAQGDADPELLQAEVDRIMADALPRGASGGFARAAEYLTPEMDRLERLSRGEDVVQGVRTGLDCVDSRLLAMQRGDLIIVAGRPSMGKSAFAACNVAADAAIRQGKRVAFFSLETRSEVVVRRILASEARVNLWAAQKNRRLRDDDYGRLSVAVGKINVAPMHVDYSPGLTLEGMRSRLRDLTREHGAPELIVVDYLQLMSNPRSRTSYDEVSAVSKGLKEIAGEFNAPLVALSQLSRNVEQRPDKRPMMSDLRESGRLEQDADVIMLMYRPEYYFGATMKTKHGTGKDARELSVNIEGKAEVILAKVREGETGTAHCAWEGAFTHFEDLRGAK